MAKYDPRFMLVPGMALMVAGCSQPGDSAVETAIERAWQQDTISMEVDAGLLTAEQAQGMKGARASTQVALGAVRAYAGSTAADVAGDAVGALSELAGDVGGAAVAPMARHAALMTARDWDATNLEVLQSRRSGGEYVLRVRYDIGASIAGRRQSVGRDLTQTIRLENRGGAWTIAPTIS
jgi:hypothetical protein